MTSPTEWAELGVSSVYEASGREGYLAEPLIRLTPGSRAAGRARTVRCADADNMGVHVACDALRPGDVLVVTSANPAPVALLGDVLATFAAARGAVAVLVDGGVRDADELSAGPLPVWARWITSTGAEKLDPGSHQCPVTIGGTVVRPGDLVILDADGAVAVRPEREAEVLGAARARVDKERMWIAQLQAGASTLDLMSLRSVPGD